MAESTPSHALDVLVCTYERPEHVVRTAVDVLAQLGPHDRLLVLDQSARVEPTARALAALADVRLRHLAAPAQGLPIARNRALAATHRPLVLFLDDDVELQPGCIDAHRQALLDPEVGGTVGFIEERSMVWNAPRTMARVDVLGRMRVRLDGQVAQDIEGLKGCNMGLRRSAIEAIGGFDPGYGGTALLEETDVAARLRAAGWRLRFVPEARLVHLSAPAGGVRVGSPLHTAHWRFHNTGRYLARNRGVASLLPALPAHAVLAMRLAVRQRAPTAAATLLRAFVAGASGR